MKILKSIKTIFLLAVGVVAMSSCQDKIDLDIPDGETFLVVEGWLTNFDTVHTVNLTYTTPYFDDTPPPVASNAEVILMDDEGNEFELLETDPGVYTYEGAGVEGRLYQLSIILDNGERYLSDPEEMYDVVPIFDIYWQLSEEEPDPDNDQNPDDIYDVLIDTQEKPGVGDYYRWRSFLNGEEYLGPDELFVAADEFVDGNEIPEFNVTEELYSIPDTVTIIQEHISREAYEFFLSIIRQTSDVGGPFDAPPAPVPGNVKNLTNPNKPAVGFFGVAAQSVATVVVGDE